MNLYITIACLLCAVDAIPIDNAVIGDPEIACEPNGITIQVATRNPFEGNFYVKSKFDTDECRTRGDSSTAQASMSLSYEQADTCLVTRERSANPRGIFSRVTVVVSFHPRFLTKVDRAYTIQCFYMEADKTVSTDIEVSMITTAFQTQVVPMPICRYEILDAPNGQPVSFAIIGQAVFHKWTCDTDTIDIFCMRVYSCSVDDGNGDLLELIDENGCAKDRYLLGNLEYPSDLMAVKEAHVFKYADRPQLYFNCQIQIEIKDPAGDCAQQTQPQCNEPGGRGDGSALPDLAQVRFKRQTMSSTAAVVDVNANFEPLDIIPQQNNDTLAQIHLFNVPVSAQLCFNESAVVVACMVSIGIFIAIILMTISFVRNKKA